MVETPIQEGIVVEHVSHSFDGTPVLCDVSLDVRPREIVSLLGPSGCGKTTMLRLIAGLEELQEGRILTDGRVLADGRINLPPEQRSVSLLFQDFALFPHLSVVENVIFGLQDWQPSERRTRALHVLNQVGMAEFAEVYPHQLSGGEQQRVALARARGPRPRMMLMDEPFSSLDTGLRRQVREIVLWVLQNSVSITLMVTHDPDEAMFMSDRIAVMEKGRIVQFDTPAELYRAPASPFVLGMFGEVTRLEGRVEAGHIQTPIGRVCAPALAEGAEAEVLVRAEGIRVDAGAPTRGKVVTARNLGGSTLLHVDVSRPGTAPIHIHARLPDRASVTTGDEIGLSIDEEHVFIFPKDGDP